MGEKNIQLFSSTGMLYSDGAPLLVSDSVLLANKRSGKKVVRLKLKNISEKKIKAIMVTVRPLDADGKAAWGDIVCPIDGLNIPRDDEFGQDKNFELLDGDVKSFHVLIGETVFEDGSVWHGDNDAWSPLPPVKTLEDAFGSDELAAQFRIRYGADCEYQPKDEHGLWFCTCGGVNCLASESKCHVCRRTYSAQKAVNLSSLKAECNQRLESEREQTEENDSESAAKKKKKLRRVLIISPIALLLALLIAVLPSYIAGRKAYNSAAALLSAGMFDQAEEAFWELGTYGDSREQAEKNVPYQKAVYLLSCADEGSTTGLALLDLRRSQFEDEEHMCIALYEGAIEIFDGLDGYADSKAKIAYAQSALDGIYEQLNSADYAIAEGLLKEGSYLAAHDAFTLLGDYKDSAERASECIYQKALVLLNYVEKYAVRGISAKLSDTAGTPDTFRVTRAALGRLTEDAITQLRALCARDGVDLKIEDGSTEGLEPMCASVEALLLSLGDYKDCPELAQRAAIAGDFTHPFYELCATGQLSAAVGWLNSYDGDFPGREAWLSTLSLYLPLCQSWQLYRGDSTLIPLTIGIDETCGNFVTAVIPTADGEATLQISFGDAGSCVELTADHDSAKFTGSTDEYSFYFAALNNLGRFTYVKYDSSGNVVSSVEYEPAK